MGQFDFWKWFWRALGVMALAFMLITTVIFWTAWRASPFVPAANGQVVENGIDIIAIQLDILSLVIAVVGIGLAVMSIIGYQAIKAAAIAKADEVATAALALHIEKQDKAGTSNGTDGGTQAPIEPGDLTQLTAEEKGE